jgi:signal transduction histidine kinase
MSSLAGVQTTAESFPVLPQVALQMIAHELRQPLSAIESIAYYFSLALPRDSRPARKQATDSSCAPCSLSAAPRTTRISRL